MLAATASGFATIEASGGFGTLCTSTAQALAAARLRSASIARWAPRGVWRSRIMGQIYHIDNVAGQGRSGPVRTVSRADGGLYAVLSSARGPRACKSVWSTDRCDRAAFAPRANRRRD